MRKSLRTLRFGALLGALSALGCGHQPAKSSRPEPRPDVVLLLLDATRADLMSVYGCERDTTPHLARLAAQAVVFDYCVSNAMWTFPSLASILTGLYVSHHGMTDIAADPSGVSDVLPEGRVTLPEAFKRAGYSTALYGSMAWYSASHDFRRGFDRLVTSEELRTRRSSLGDSVESEAYGTSSRKNDKAALDLAVANARAHRDSANPLFTYIHLVGPHSPLALPVEQLGHFVNPDEYERYLKSLGPDFGFQKSQNTQQAKRLEEDSEFRDFYRRLYMEALHYTDQIVSDFILECRRIRPNTLCIITADHGESLLDRHMEYLHGPDLTPYDPIIHVPLIFYWPSQLRPRRVQEPVMLADLYPTLADLLGFRDPDGRNTDGVSLAKALSQSAAETDRLRNRFCMAEGSYAWLSYAVVHNNMKLIDRHPATANSVWRINNLNRIASSEALYALGTPESENLRFSFPETAATLRNDANSVLLGRRGWHLVFVGDGRARPFASRVEMDTDVNRCTIRYHNEESSFDTQVAKRSDLNLLSPKMRNLSILPGETVECSVDLKAAQQSPQPGLAPITYGIRFKERQTGGPLRIEFSAPENPAVEKCVDVVSPQLDKDPWFVRCAVADAYRKFFITFRNEGGQPVEITDCFAQIAPISVKSYQVDGGKIDSRFFLADGLVDLNWRCAKPPENLAFVSEGSEGSGNRDSLYVWQKDGFVEKSWPLRLGAEEIALVEPHRTEPAIQQLMDHAREQARRAVYVYRCSDSGAEKVSVDEQPVQMDEETVRNLKGLGYL